jgi:hypothetical protein
VLDVGSWEAQLARLVAYKAEHGDCNVPRGWAKNSPLAVWVNKQRTFKKELDRGEPSTGMTAARAAQLDALGFAWDPQRDWEGSFATLAAYKVEHGDCNVPWGWAKGSGLGSWVTDQRALKRKLDRGEPSKEMTAVRADRLTALGLVWDQNEAEWEAQLERLAAYKAAHGDCSVPFRWAEDLRLGRWVKDQRALKRKLDHGEPSRGMTAARAARLTALGLVWDQDMWEVQLARMAAYKAAHGDCNVPKRWAEDPRLGTWVNTQRHLKRKLDRGEPSNGMTAERAARLTALGLVWDPPRYRQGGKPNEVVWEAQLARLAAYKAAHGDCSVPFRWAEDLRLGRWVKDQRLLKRKLDHGEPSRGMTAARAARLTALGFAWEDSRGTANEAAWEAQLARLVAYKGVHGDCNVPKGWAENPPLGAWVNTQRLLKRKLDHGEPSNGMTAERAAKLTSLGFNWRRKLTRQKRAWQKCKAKRSSEDPKSSGSASGAPKKRPRLRPTQLAESTGHRFLDSFAELCECRNTPLEGMYSGRWYRVTVTAADDGAGAHLLYLDTDETELLRPADFEPRSWRVRGGGRAGKGVSSPELASQESEEEGSQEEGVAKEGSGEDEHSEEEDSEEEGRLLGSLLDVAGSLFAGE